jgi:hypothetical protein
VKCVSLISDLECANNLQKLAKEGEGPVALILGPIGCLGGLGPGSFPGNHRVRFSIAAITKYVALY